MFRVCFVDGKRFNFGEIHFFRTLAEPVEDMYTAYFRARLRSSWFLELLSEVRNGFYLPCDLFIPLSVDLA